MATTSNRDLTPPASLGGEAKARWIALAPQLARPFDRDVLETYCQVWARWRQAEETLAKTSQIVKTSSGSVVASPLIAVSNQAATQLRSLEKRLGLSDAAPASEEAKRRRGGRERSKLLTRREVAAALSVHMQTVTKWEQEGMPVAQRGSKGRASFYREVDVRAWLQARDEVAKAPGAVNLVQERSRKERAQALLAEQSYAIRMRDLVPREEIERAWFAESSAVRAKLLAWPSALADQLFRTATTEGLAGVERILATAVRDVLRELSDASRAPGLGPAQDAAPVPS